MLSDFRYYFTVYFYENANNIQSVESFGELLFLPSIVSTVSNFGG